MNTQPAQIVLIEDNPADVFLVELALKKYGIDYFLLKFQTSQDAVRSLCVAPKKGDRLPDLILMDLNTPRSDGFESLRDLKRSSRLARVPIAILTSSRARSDKLQAAGLGIPYIEKPSQLDPFLTSVGQVVKEILNSEKL